MTADQVREDVADLDDLAKVLGERGEQFVVACGPGSAVVAGGPCRHPAGELGLEDAVGVFHMESVCWPAKWSVAHALEVVRSARKPRRGARVVLPPPPRRVDSPTAWVGA